MESGGVNKPLLGRSEKGGAGGRKVDVEEAVGWIVVFFRRCGEMD